MPLATVSAASVPPTAQNINPAIGSVENQDQQLPKLFTPLTSKSVTFHNRIVIPPLCMYSSIDGFFNDFHAVHYGSLALRGPGMIIIESTAVEPRGRISPDDAGLWSDKHIAPLKRVVDVIKSQGSIPAIQIAHAGRKANMSSDWDVNGGYQNVSEANGGWPNDVVGASELPFDKEHAQPHALTVPEMQAITQKWVDATVRADKAGIEVIEIHSAHG